jgi:hypothetical protein
MLRAINAVERVLTDDHDEAPHGRLVAVQGDEVAVAGRE